jgi:hypothetical protein
MPQKCLLESCEIVGPEEILRDSCIPFAASCFIKDWFP